MGSSGSGQTTTTQQMSPEARQIMMRVLTRADPLLDKPAISEEQAGHRQNLANYYNSQDYKAPNEYMRNQGMQLMQGGVAGNPFNNGTRMLTQDRNIGNDPYSLNGNGQRNDFSEVRNGAMMNPQGAGQAPMLGGGGKMGMQMPQGKMGGLSMAPPDRAMQSPPGMPMLGGAPMQGGMGGGMQKPMMQAAPNAQMSDDEFNAFLNRNRAQYGGGQGG